MSDPPMTVVQTLPALHAGGVEQGTLEVARELVRQGHRSIVIAAGGRLAQRLIAEGSEHLDWPIGRKSLTTLRLIPRLRRWLRREQVDILHVRSRLPAWMAWQAWKGLPPERRPHLVSTVHGMYSVSRYSAIMTRGERVIAVSGAVRDYIVGNYPQTDPARIRVIPRGVDPRAFPHGYRPAQHWLQDWYQQYPDLLERIVLTLPGRVTRLKGHEAFITLIDTLRREFPVHGLIVGQPDPRHRGYHDQLQRRIRELGLTRDISFTGHRSDVREIMAVSNLVLSLSNKPESFGRTVVEALSLGVPVVGYDHGGVGEILAQCFPAGRVALGDQPALAERCTALIGAPPQLPPLQHYRLDAMLDATLACYRELTRPAGPGPAA